MQGPDLAPNPPSIPSMELRVSELYRRVERGALFAHSALSDGFTRLAEMQSFVFALGDLLIAKGLVGESELVRTVEAVRADLDQRGGLKGPGLIARFDRDDASDRPAAEIDCAARLHICNAVCCRLDFTLSIAEVKSARVQWDTGRPYFIRHGRDGRCVHHDAQCVGCRVYADRSRVCRSYDSRNDERIWKDFERMELNTEWIEANLSEQPRSCAHVVSLDPLGPRSDAPPASEATRSSASAS